jgi:hypothetical protein
VGKLAADLAVLKRNPVGMTEPWKPIRKKKDREFMQVDDLCRSMEMILQHKVI